MAFLRVTGTISSFTYIHVYSHTTLPVICHKTHSPAGESGQLDYSMFNATLNNIITYVKCTQCSCVPIETPVPTVNEEYSLPTGESACAPPIYFHTLNIYVHVHSTTSYIPPAATNSKKESSHHGNKQIAKIPAFIIWVCG